MWDGTTWSTIKLHGQPWCYMVNHNTTKSTMILHGEPWYYMVNHDTTWSTMILHGGPCTTWLTMKNPNKNNKNLQTLRTAASLSRSKTSVFGLFSPWPLPRPRILRAILFRPLLLELWREKSAEISLKSVKISWKSADNQLQIVLLHQKYAEIYCIQA